MGKGSGYFGPALLLDFYLVFILVKFHSLESRGSLLTYREVEEVVVNGEIMMAFPLQIGFLLFLL